jgi:hypothetical protein
MRPFARGLHCRTEDDQDADDEQEGLSAAGRPPASRAYAGCAAGNSEALVDQLKGLACWPTPE